MDDNKDEKRETILLSATIQGTTVEIPVPLTRKQARVLLEGAKLTAAIREAVRNLSETEGD